MQNEPGGLRMNKYLLSIFALLLVFSTNVYAKKVKEVGGLKVPKGITATYDDLENVVTASGKYSKSPLIYTLYRYPELFLRLKYDMENNTIKPEFELNLHTKKGEASRTFKLETFIDVTNFDVFVRNSDGTKKYNSAWTTKQIANSEINTYDRTSIFTREYGFVNDTKLADFLLENLNEKSEIVLRFYSAQGGNIEAVLSKGDVKKLLNTIKFYEQLKNLENK